MDLAGDIVQSIATYFSIQVIKIILHSAVTRVDLTSNTHRTYLQ